MANKNCWSVLGYHFTSAIYYLLVLFSIVLIIALVIVIIFMNPLCSYLSSSTLSLQYGTMLVSFVYCVLSMILWAVSAWLLSPAPSVPFSSGLVCFAHWRGYRRGVKRMENVKKSGGLALLLLLNKQNDQQCMTERSRLCCCGDIDMPRRLSGCPSLFHLLPWSPRNTFVYTGKRFGRIFYGMDGFVGTGINYPMFY